MQGLSIETIELLLLIAAIVSMLARRLRVPYMVALVIAGLGLSFLPPAFNLELTKQTVFTVFLPPLVFEAAYQTRWKALRRELGVVTLFATGGVFISAAVCVAAMHYAAHWAWGASLLFGVLISATDPVGVLAIFKEWKVAGRLPLIAESESLVNDGTVAVLFAVSLASLNGQAVTPQDIGAMFIETVLGGIVCGALVGVVILLLAGRTEDTFVEITFTTVAAFGSFLLAEHFGFSGILSTMTAGIVVGNVEGPISRRGREAVDSFWRYAAFVVNSLIFLLIGTHLAGPLFSRFWAASLLAIVSVLVGRALAVYGCSGIFYPTKWRIPISFQHILVWGGLRGALALALVLSLPSTLAERPQITAAAFAVVAFSVIVQGITISPVMGKLGVLAKPHAPGAE